MRIFLVQKRLRRAFSLVEVVVVIGITAILMAMSLGYNRNSERQIIIFSEQAKVAGIFERAKTLALTRYKKGDTDFCGIGVYFDIDRDPNELIIFGDNSNSCGNYDVSGVNNDKVIESQPIDGRLEIKSGARGSVIFKPPYGEVAGGNLLSLSAPIVFKKRKNGGGAA